MPAYDPTIPLGFTLTADCPAYPTQLHRKRPRMAAEWLTDTEIDQTLARMFPSESSRHRIPATQYGRRLVVLSFARLVALQRQA